MKSALNTRAMFLRFALCLTVMLGLCATTRPASAAGSVRPEKTKINEYKGRWKVKLVIRLPRAPQKKFVTLRLLVRPTAIYETFLDDSSPKEKTRKVPQDKNIRPEVLTFDAGFSDVRTGKIYNRTKFDFKIRRDAGFEAGEYKFEVRDSENHAIGRPFKLTLEGKNKLVDRRSMTFTGKKAKKKKKADDGEKAAPPPSDDKADEAAAPPAEEGDGSAGGDVDGAGEAPDGEVIKEKPGGCGCQIPGPSDSPAALGWLALGAAGLAALRRRRA